MKERVIHVSEKSPGKPWASIETLRLDRGFPEPIALLRWIIEQLLFDHVDWRKDEATGEVDGVEFGRIAAESRLGQRDFDEFVDECQKLFRSIEIFSLVEISVKCDIPPEWVHRVRQQIEVPPALNFDLMRKMVILYRWLGELDQRFDRINRMANVEISDSCPAEVRFYFKQASEAYSHGLWGAAVAMSRSALESAVKVIDQDGALSWNLAEAINRLVAQGRLDGPHAAMASALRRTANRVIHGQVATETDAESAADCARAVIQHLFQTP